jgi:hypothetical protein
VFMMCSGGTTRAKVEMLAGLWMVAFLSVGTLAGAADADRRLVAAAAGRSAAQTISNS